MIAHLATFVNFYDDKLLISRSGASATTLDETMASEYNRVSNEAVWALCPDQWRMSAKGVQKMPSLDELAQQIRACPLCRLCKARTLAVPGEGPEDARLMFVGEGPGFHEDQQGRPFVGAAGQFLETLLASIKLTRQDVYITNVVKCRPPNNRDPQPDELAACRPYLDQQIALIRPQMIVTLGRFSMQIAFMGVSISQVHGIPKKVGDIVYLPVFHPAAALHQVRFKAAIEEDFLKIPQILAELSRVEPAELQENQERPQQLSLF